MIPGHNNICIITCFWGEWPEYFSYFLGTAGRNSLVNFILFTDNELPVNSFKNISKVEMSMHEFQKLSSEKLGFNIEFSDPYKTCDFKPLFGFIFKEHLKEYDYWGFCDIDIIFGDLDIRMYELLEDAPDILSTYKEFIAGPFSIFKNSDYINELFKNCPDYKHILQDPTHRAFDENIARSSIQGFSLKKSLSFLGYSIREILTPRFRIKSISELRYGSQCDYKRRTIDPDHPSDMSELVFSESKNKKIQSRFLPLMMTEPYLQRNNQQRWEFAWQNGKLYNNYSGEKLFGFHFQKSKTNAGFKVPGTFDGGPFTINPGGIYSN